MNFSELGLTGTQLRACESLGYTIPTAIQAKAIPIILRGEDLIGCAETGTGKTAAFLLPIIQKICERSRPGVRLLVLAPTRELAMQIDKNYGELNRAKSNRCITVIGGTNIRTQIADLKRGATAVIAVVASAAFNVLELFVAFLQAYIITFLSALFIGASIHKH